MSEFNRPTTEEEFDSNFSQIKPLMSANQAYYESSRCLFCYDAPCIKACPTGIDIPLFIRQIKDGNEVGAAKTIYDSNWLGNACGKVCPTEVLCEGACVYNHQEVKVIEIGRLQNFATCNVIEKDIKLYQLAPRNGKKVAIVGAGPSGISCACELSMLGYEVEIFEAKMKPSGLTVHGVAPYKITNEEALAEIEYLQNQFRFTIKYDAPISMKASMDKLAQNYDAVFLGIGLGTTRSIGLVGEGLENCHGATEFIERLKAQHHKEKSVGSQVIVLGGGNTAMDAASEVARMGAASVTLAYRNSKENMAAYEFEYDLAKQVGVEGLFNVQPVEILGKTKVEGVKFIRTESAGTPLSEIPGSEFVLPADTVILATGQKKQATLLALIDNLELDTQQRIIVNELHQTTNPKFFAGGDAVNGGAEVVNAAAEGKMAAQGMHLWLSGS